MDELDKKLKEILDTFVGIGQGLDPDGSASDEEQKNELYGSLPDIKQAFKDAGYIHLPNSQGKNVTIYTSDNPEPLMTDQEWREKFAEAEANKDGHSYDG